MKLLGLGSVLAAIVLAASGCGSASRTQTGESQLPQSLRAFIASTTAFPDGKVSEIDVYGPGSRTALNKAVNAGTVYELGKEVTYRYYLVVYHGHFVCENCHGPPRMKPPHGTIVIAVWSQQEGKMDGGIMASLPPAVSKLHRLATIPIS
jgi:hypothetical protein